MQGFTDILKSTLIKDSLRLLLDNDRTALSNNSGTSFPTDNLIDGMTCYRTDLGKRYILTNADKGIWKECKGISIYSNIRDIGIYDNSRGYIHFDNGLMIEWGEVSSEDIKHHLYRTTNDTSNKVKFIKGFTYGEPMIIGSISSDNVYVCPVFGTQDGFWLSDASHSPLHHTGRTKYNDSFSWIAIGKNDNGIEV